MSDLLDDYESLFNALVEPLTPVAEPDEHRQPERNLLWAILYDAARGARRGNAADRAWLASDEPHILTAVWVTEQLNVSLAKLRALIASPAPLKAIKRCAGTRHQVSARGRLAA